MKTKFALLVVGLISISLTAGATSYFGDIVDGGGEVTFGDDGGPILWGNLEFPSGSAQWGQQTAFTMQVDVGLVAGPDLGPGVVPYTQFISLSTDPAVTFSTAQLTLFVLADLFGENSWLSVGDSATIYTNDGSGWAPYAEAQVQELLGGDAYILTATIESFSDWGGIGDDPIIPDPSIVSIIGCGLLLLSRKLRS